MVTKRINDRMKKLRSRLEIHEYDLSIILPGEDISERTFNPKAPIIILDLWDEDVEAVKDDPQ